MPRIASRILLALALGACFGVVSLQAQHRPLAGDAVRRDQAATSSDMLRKVLIDGEGSIFDLVTNLREQLPDNEPQRAVKIERLWIAELALDSPPRIAKFKARIDGWKELVKAEKLDRFDLFDYLLIGIEPMLAVQDTDAVLFLAQTIRAEFPEADFGRRLEFTAHFLAGDLRAAALDLVGFLGLKGWLEDGFEILTLSQPSYGDSFEETRLHCAYWRTMMFPQWMPAMQSLGSATRAETSALSYRIDYALPELELWARAAANNAELGAYLKTRREESSAWAYLAAAYDLERAILSGERAAPAQQALGKAYKAFAQARNFADGVVTPAQAWWTLRAHCAAPTEVPAQISALFSVILQQVSRLPRTTNERFMYREGLPHFTDAMDHFGAELLVMAADANTFLATLREFEVAYSKIRMTGGGTPSRMAMLALRELRKSNPELAREVLNREDFKSDSLAAFFLPVVEGMNFNASLRAYRALAETRVHIALDAPVALDQSSYMRENLYAESLDYSDQFRYTITRIMGTGEVLDLGAMIARRAESFTKAIALDQKAATALLAASDQDKHPALDPSDSESMIQPLNYVQAAANSRVLEFVHANIQWQGEPEPLMPSLVGVPVLAVGEMAAALAEAPTDAEEALATARRILPETFEHEQYKYQLSPWLRVRMAIAQEYLTRYAFWESAPKEFKEMITNHPGNSTSPSSISSIFWVEHEVDFLFKFDPALGNAVLSNFMRHAIHVATQNPSASIFTADPLFDFGYPDRFSKWLEPDDKNLRLLKQQMVAGRDLQFDSSALFTQTLNNYAWSLHKASTEPEITARAAYLQLLVGSDGFPERAYTKNMSSPTNQSFLSYFAAGAGLTTSSVGAPIDTHAWGLFESDYKEKALKMEEWGLRLSPGNFGYVAALTYFHSHEAPKASIASSAPEKEKPVPEKKTPEKTPPGEKKPAPEKPTPEKTPPVKEKPTPEKAPPEKEKPAPEKPTPEKTPPVKEKPTPEKAPPEKTPPVEKKPAPEKPAPEKAPPVKEKPAPEKAPPPVKESPEPKKQDAPRRWWKPAKK